MMRLPHVLARALLVGASAALLCARRLGAAAQPAAQRCRAAPGRTRSKAWT